MTKEEIKSLVDFGEFAEPPCARELVETHISWVILCNQFAYKIKKPIHYSFLDFSTLEKRKHFCLREIELNRRLCDNVYLDVLPVRILSGFFFIGEGPGQIVDCAVRMCKLDKTRQMDVMLKNNQIEKTDITNLAKKIAAFHRKTDIICKDDFLDIQDKFNDLEKEQEFLAVNFNNEIKCSIKRAITSSNLFIEKNKDLFKLRMQEGFFRDCHGDLHTRNIFLLPEPEPFDCIEFNDDYRQIDTLNEISFLCMDLDSFGREDLSGIFLTCYNNEFFSMRNMKEKMLFIYYKSYRANIRAKINSLRAQSAEDDLSKNFALSQCDKYIKLMSRYLNMIELCLA